MRTDAEQLAICSVERLISPGTALDACVNRVGEIVGLLSALHRVRNRRKEWHARPVMALAFFKSALIMALMTSSLVGFLVRDCTSRTFSGVVRPHAISVSSPATHALATSSSFRIVSIFISADFLSLLTFLLYGSFSQFRPAVRPNRLPRT